VSIIIVASFTPKPGRRDALREAFSAAAAKVVSEPGCERYSVQEDEEGFVFVERWASEEAIAEHEKAEAFTTMMAAVTDDLAGPPGVRLLSPLPAEDPKGSL